MLDSVKKTFYRALAKFLQHVLDESHAWGLLEKRLGALRQLQKQTTAKQARIESKNRRLNDEIRQHRDLLVLESRRASEAFRAMEEQLRMQNEKLRLEESKNKKNTDEIAKLRSQLEAAPFSLLADRSVTVPEPRDSEMHYPDDRGFLLDLLDSLLADDCGGLSKEEQCLRILRYLSSHIELGAIECLTPPSIIIKGQKASCGGFGEAFADMARAIDIPARYLGLFGLPGAASHALVEAWYDGGWHLFDPTFGIFFYSTSSYDQKGRVLSAAQIVTAIDAPFMMKVVDRPWQKNFSDMAGYGVRFVEDQPAFHVRSYWSEDCRRAAFPVAYGNSAVVSFPVDVDLTSSREVKIGGVDGDWKDIYVNYYSNPRVGYFYLGAVCPTSLHTLQIRAPSRRKIIIRYFCTEKKGLALELFPLDSVHLIRRNHDATFAIFEVLLTQDSGTALVFAPVFFQIDAMVFQLAEDC